MLKGMRWCIMGVALSAVMLTACVLAEDTAEQLEDLDPNYTAPAAKSALFQESFDDTWKNRWHVLTADDRFNGEWVLTAGKLGAQGIPGDKGLAMTTAGSRHGMAAKFDKLVNNKDKTFVVQYELRAEKAFGCDGGYIKLLSNEIDPSEFSDKTDYTIMFGPDKCGSTDKVHFILRHKNPLTGEFEEKHLKEAPKVKNDKRTHVYTLIVRKDNSFEIHIDGDVAKSGSLLTDMDPPVNPPAEIDDPTDKKPSDWVDDEYIDDPEDKKPDDWDEDAPAKIDDPDATKPSGWLDDEPLTIPDPKGFQPDDWDEEEDGAWEAPMVSNPKCAPPAGCGEWKPPQIKNPAYKGKWSPKRIVNPAYKGVWKAKQIPNPNYYEDKNPADFTPIGGVGIELLTNSGDFVFDNILVTDNEEAAEDFLSATWSKRHEREVETIDDSSNPKNPLDGSFIDRLGSAIEANPVPFIIGTVTFAIILLLLIWKCCLSDDDEIPLPPSVVAQMKKDDDAAAAQADDDTPAEGAAEDDKDDKAASKPAAKAEGGAKKRKPRKD